MDAALPQLTQFFVFVVSSNRIVRVQRLNVSIPSNSRSTEVNGMGSVLSIGENSRVGAGDA